MVIVRSILTAPLKKASAAFLLSILLTGLLLFQDHTVYAQGSPVMIRSVVSEKQDPFGIQRAFIQNVGQYGDTLSGFGYMGKILYGYEGIGMPVLMTPKGWIHLLRKVNGEGMEALEREREEQERKARHGKPEEIWETPKVKDGAISFEWMGANPTPVITTDMPSAAYHSYGYLTKKAYSYKRITYTNLYPGIDLVFSFVPARDHGFEYSLIVHPGSDIGAVQLKVGGSYKRIRKKLDGSLFISSPLGDINIATPTSYYGTSVQENAPVISSVAATFENDTKNNELHFRLGSSYDKSRTLIIDPFVSGTGSLVGLNNGKAKDVDFDYAGNVYVTGGGDGSTHKLAKYDASGTLLWTFSGTLTLPSWTFGLYWGGWMVEKPTGNIYLGQGFNPGTGFQVIRVSTTGLYDNYITSANANFREAWKMLWSCNNGSPQILVAGGGTNSNINFGVFTPPSTAIGSLNVTGIPYTVSAGWAQDIVDFVIDPSNNDMYTLYGSLIGNPSLTNQIYKNTFPYSGGSVAWNVPSGFTTVQEIANRPYLLGGQIDNSANIFAINSSYLFFWDGKNLKAFDKATGNGVGTPLITANTALMQGGIVADACNNVFVGDGNGVIKVYKFNGTTFDDAGAPDIAIAGNAGKAVYDLAYDESKKIIYASGDGFVASFDVSAYCPTTQYTLIATPNCLTSSVTVTVSPAPPTGSIINYTLFNGSTQLGTNTTGIFTGLLPGITYTVVATINQACSGQQATTTFVMPGPAVTVSSTNTTCGSNTGTITASGSGSTAPYTYSIDGINYQAGGNFTGLAAGVYTVSVKDAAGCITTKVVTLLNSNGPSISVVSTNADCGSNNGTITATLSGGTAPYQYSLNGGPYQGSNFFTGLLGGSYTLTVKDAGGCTNSQIVTITSSPRPSIIAIPATASCGNNNGSITAFGSGGTAPLQYSINGNIFQSSGNFANLTPGSYTVTVKDANGCTQTTTVTIDNSPAPTVTAVATPATCNNVNGIITVTATGGIAPLQYSINGSFFQSSNIFTGIAPGTHTITVKDGTGCTNTVTVTVGSIGGPTASATSTVSACNTSNGSITITGSGGTPGYTYSINGTVYQASNVFAGVGAGTFVAYVKDANGCVGTFIVVVSNTAGPSITASATPTSCNSNTGVITATGAGGVAPLQYSIDGVTYQASNVFTGLATGLYTVYVKDANGCARYTTVTITNVSNLNLTTSAIFSSCSGSSGAITATATGGIAPLTYSINGVNYFPSNVFTGLAPGVYQVSVKDANGCIVTKPATIQSVTGPSLTLAGSNGTCGAANGIIFVNGAGGIAPYTYSIDAGAFQPNRVFINVAAGLHTITIKDATGCTASQTITITSTGTGTPPTDVTFTVRDALACTGGAGRIKNLKGQPSGGGNTYTFALDLGPFTTANQFTNVPPGVHTITAKNSAGCTVTKIVTIGSGTPATATATVTPAACNTPNGSITISGVGANTPYHASFDNGATWVTFFPPGANSTTVTGLTPGTYPVIMADDADFTAGPPDIPGACLTTLYVVVPASNGPSISTTQINGTCNAPNGSITATGSGGTAPYSYNINGGPYFASGVFNNLIPGTYAIGVKDATGCTSGTTVTLTNAANPTVTATFTSTSCNQNNGSITATAIGGTAPLQYSINGTTFQNSNIFTNLSPGTYTLYVKDATGCYGTTLVTIANTPIPIVTAFTIAATCNNNDGSIVATGTLGEAPYSYSIDGIAYQSNNTFSNLTAGFYTIYIKDNRGCVSTTGVSVANTSAPVIAATIVVPANCDHPTGSITVTGTGGTAPLLFSIDGINFQAATLFSTLLPGNYTVYVRDANGCLTTKAVNVGNVPGPQTLTATLLNAACGQPNGSITAAATGGTAPLQYSLDGITYQSGTNFPNLAAGNYTLYVKDANGCLKTLPVNLINLPGPIPSVSSSPATCGATDGTITVGVSSGTGAITYSIDGINFQSSNIFTGLAAGSYTVTVKDTRGCTNSTAAIVNTIGSSVTPVFAPVGPICAGSLLPPLPTTSINGITGSWSPAINNTNTTTYLFTPSPGQCATSTTLTIVVNPNITPTFTPVAAICSGGTLAPLPTTSTNGVTGTWAPALNNTATTTYTFTPTAGQCATNATLTITVNPNITPNFNSVAAICAGDILTPLPTTSTNGITGTWSPALNNTTTTIYTFTPTAGQCATSTTIVITVNPRPTAPIVSIVQPTCSITSGTAIITSSTAGLTFSLDSGPFNSYPGGGYTGLAPGPHTLVAQNSSGCISVTTAFTINGIPVGPSAISYTSNNATCGNSNGSIILGAVTGGSAPYTYSFDGSPFTVTTNYTNLGAGNHTVIISDANGCTFTSVVVVNNANGASVTATSTNSTCGNPNGSITATGTGGAAPYQYSIDGINFQPSNSFTGLAGGPYTLTIKDANGCINTTGVTIANTAGATVTATTSNSTCGNSNGLITATGAGGTAPYQYSINGTTYQASSLFSGLGAGIYTVSIKDANGCINNTTATIANSTGATVTAVTSNSTCGNNNGTITASGSGGTAPYQYSIDGINFQSGAIFTGLAAGNYTLTIKDANGCINSISTVVANSSGATVTGNSSSSSCGNSNGSITATGTGGTTPYQYSINGTVFQSSNLFSGLAAGSYTLTIKDANGCTNTSLVVVANIAGATVTASASNSSCGNANGSITATGNGGTVPYQFSIDGINYQPSNTFTGLPAGNYTISIKDANGCINTTSATIANNTGATVALTGNNSSCGNNNGSITATGSGGSTPYQYSIDGTNYQSSNIFNGLAAGNYTISIKDANGCINTATITVTNIAGATVTANSTNTSCGSSNGSITATGTGGTTPYQYSIDGINFQSSNSFTNLTAGTYTITLRDANSCINTTIVTITNTNGATITGISTNTACVGNTGTITVTGSGGLAPYQFSIDGINFQSGNLFSGLGAGNYIVTIKDANNCTNTTSIPVGTSTGASVTTVVNNSSCGVANGSITASGTGGAAPYQFSIDGTNYQNNGLFTGLTSGNYTISIKDANGCINSSSVSISNIPGATVTGISSNSHCGNADGSISAVGNGGTNPYQYSIDGINFQSNPNFTGLAAGSYTLSIRDANNCINTTTVIVSNIAGATVTGVSTNSSCGTANGTVVATGAGGTAPYQYSIDGTNYQSASTFNGLLAGSYTIAIKDANNCINTVVVIVNDTPGATVTAISNSSSCGNANGSITATGTGGSSPYQFSIDGTNFQSGNNFPGLAAGNYTVTIKDANNCINSTTVIVSNSNGAVVTAISSNSTCGNNNGSITASGSGGTAPYQYSIDGINFQSSNIFNSLAAGSFTITIKDANNCINAVNVVVNNIAGATVTALSANSSCGNNNGSITATGTGGTAPYQYSIDGISYQASNVFNALAAGNYTVSIRDASNCINTTTVIIQNSNGASITATSTNSTCGNNNGSITATGSGGTAPYQFSIDGTNFQASNTFSGLVSGNYTITIKDANNCINTTAVILINIQGATVTATTTNSTCGNNNGSITATGVGGTAPYQYSIDGINFQSSALFNGIASGNYTVTIKDANGCTNTTVVTINASTGPSLSGVSTDAACGNTNGSITVTATGGSSPYQYSLNGGAFQSSNQFNGLAAGSYSLAVKDANGCSTTITIAVNNANGPSVTANSSSASCSNANGSITAVASAGVAPYQYSLDGINYQPSNVFAGIAAGPYTVSVKDANGCINSVNIVVNGTSGPSITASSIAATCGNNNGSITATGNNGTSPYQYSMDGTNYQSSNQFNGLAAGSYSVYIKDANGCTNVTTITLSSSGGPSVTVTATGATCGNNNGTITATGSNGTAPYQYSLDGINFQSSNQFIAVAAGTYTIYIKDANGCINSASVIVPAGTGPSVAATSTASSCGNNNGSITATGSNGTAPYQFSIDGTNYQTANQFTGIAAGNYTIYIKDVNGCVNSTSVTVLNTNGPSIAATANSSTCGNSNGSITAAGSNGVAPYQYSINNGSFQSNAVFTGLGAGSYTIVVKDVNGCTSSITVIVGNIAGPSATTSVINASCGNNNGSITIQAIGGTAPYQYLLDAGTAQSSNIFTGVAAGTHTVTVKDANGCNAILSIVITNTAGATVSATTTTASCGNNNGRITAAGNGGTSPYSYALNGGNYQTSNSFINLAAGTYSLTIRDGNNCTNTISVVVAGTTGANITATTTPSTCGSPSGSITATGTGGSLPYQFSLNNGAFQASNTFSSLVNGSYTVSIRDANGCINSTVVIVSDINPISVDAGTDQNICEGTAVLLNASSNATSFSWSPATGLSNPSILKPLAAPRSTTQYILTASDGQCSRKDTVVVTVRPAPLPDAGKDITLCFGVNGKLNGSGGVQYKWSPVTYLSNSNTATPTILAPPSGSYQYLLQVTDNAGCQSLKADTVIVKVLPPARVFAGNDTMIAVNQPLSLKAIDLSNSGFISYTWNPARGLNNPSIQNPIALLDKEITYTVIARTAEGCEASDDIHVKVFQKADLFVPNAFTPNHDGRNDVLHVIPVGIKELTYFRIYNRWGQLIFSTTNLAEGWNGLYKGQEQSTATFVWMAEGVDYLGHTITKKGTVTLIR